MLGKEYKMDKPTEFTTVNEGSRTYHYLEGSLCFKNIESVCIRPSGSHRLNLKDGRKVVVVPGWKALEISGIDDWIF